LKALAITEGKEETVVIFFITVGRY